MLSLLSSVKQEEQHPLTLQGGEEGEGQSFVNHKALMDSSYFLILYFINPKMHTFSHFDISEIKTHPTLDDALQLKLAAYFLS